MRTSLFLSETPTEPLQRRAKRVQGVFTVKLISSISGQTPSCLPPPGRTCLLESAPPCFWAVWQHQSGLRTRVPAPRPFSFFLFSKLEHNCSRSWFCMIATERDFASHSAIPFDENRKVWFSHIKGNGKITVDFYLLSPQWGRVSFGIWLLQEPVIPDKSLHISFLSHSWSSEMRDLEFGEGQFLLAFSSETVTEMDWIICTGQVGLLYLSVEWI